MKEKLKNIAYIVAFITIVVLVFAFQPKELAHATTNVGSCPLTVPGGSINCATSVTDVMTQTLLQSLLNTVSSGQLPVPLPIQGNQSTDCSTTLSSSAANLCSGSIPVHGYEICNPNASGDLWFSDTTTAAVNGVGSKPLLNTNPNKCYNLPIEALPIGPLSVIGSTTGLKVTARFY
jgi:hypothetical protein